MLVQLRVHCLVITSISEGFSDETGLSFGAVALALCQPMTHAWARAVGR